MKICPQCNQRYPDDSAFCFVDGSTLNVPDDPRIGTTIAGRYVLEARIGRGGMATVYRARARLLNGARALKLLSPDLAQDPTTRERFLREVKNSRRLVHPNVVEIFDHGDSEDGIPYMVMELLQGSSLSQIIEQGRVPVRRALPIWIQMTRALARAHDFDIIHRDLKPENVFILHGDRVKLLDFGIALSKQDARLTSMGEVFGTPQYMAPERIRSADATGASDLYALGILMFEMLAKKLPFQASDPTAWLAAHLKQTPPRIRELVPDAPDSLDSLIAQLLEKEPMYRPVDAHRVLLDLNNIAGELGIQIPPDAEARAPALLGAPPGADLWARRGDLFDRMFKRAGSPPELARQAESLKNDSLRLSEILTRAQSLAQTLASLEEGGYRDRFQIGQQMEARSSEASSLRAEARSARARVVPLANKAKAYPSQVQAAHKDLIFWEGRSGFTEPYRELAQAYKKLADLCQQWFTVRQQELEAEAMANDRERQLGEIDAQIREFRTRLADVDGRVENDRKPALEGLSKLGSEADQVEGQLLMVASRFCGPMRSKPELGQLFQELLRDSQKAAGK
ncbi:MAG: protein kinase [Polyangiaceae bacterium]|nr:protein kinase [Polyangiaceae bacterium]